MNLHFQFPALSIEQRVIDRLNPFVCAHYSRDGVFSKGSINIVTLIWACVVLYRTDALDVGRFALYAGMVRVFPENYWAMLALSCSATGTVRLFTKSFPRWWDLSGYFCQMAFWTFLPVSLLLDSTRAIAPASFAALSFVAVVSAWALLTIPKYSHGRHCQHKSR